MKTKTGVSWKIFGFEPMTYAYFLGRERDSTA